MKLHYPPFSLNALFLALAALPGQPCAAGNEPAPEMVVTATRVEREVFNTPQAVTVLDDLAVEQANAGTTPDLLSGTEGVLIQKTNPGGGSPFIRGLTGKQVLILVDGVRMNNSNYRFGPHQYLNTLDPILVERIEVVRGPTSVLYGSDALAGVINVITRKRADFSDARGTEGLAVLHGASADASLAGRLQVEGNFSQLGYLGGISGKRFNSLEGGGDVGEQRPTAYDELDGDLKLNYRPAGGGELIFAHQTTPGGGSPFIRGLTGKQVLILVDGVRMNNSNYRFGPHQYLNTLDPILVERIEVVRGPTSVLYGSDALAGVINVIT
ncbi:MAG: TonB-dependent receptor plug domain-containing protein, partial [Candidatus Thermoplasmatota archaeon]|nr:TonB-dependent receptor plug domain-containing protein [Candidatus Thermoplasmatota archaeon]